MCNLSSLSISQKQTLFIMFLNVCSIFLSLSASRSKTLFLDFILYTGILSIVYGIELTVCTNSYIHKTLDTFFCLCDKEAKISVSLSVSEDDVNLIMARE